MASGQFPPVGNPTTANQVDSELSACATLLEQLSARAMALITKVTANGGITFLEKAGYSNDPASSNPGNPGGQTDAAYALELINYMSTLVGVYQGTATQSTDFNFAQALSILWS